MTEGSNSKLDQFKFETIFHLDDAVSHILYKHDSLSSQETAVETIRWSHKRVLGTGAFGTVTLQEDPIGRLRAVKRLYRGGRINYNMELKALCKVSDRHDLFVQFFGWYEDAHFLFIAMEFIEYGDLSQYMKSAKHTVGCNVKEITRQVLEGLQVLHSKDICHRDLKPQNILIALPEPVWVKIADFGASKYMKDTQLRTLTGTTGYIAPEILGLIPGCLRRRGYTNAVDLWALGCIVYEMLTTKTPFTVCTAETVSDWSGVESGLITSIPETDMSLLNRFCLGQVGFPAERLEESYASDNATSFIQRLLLANPSSRPSALDALKSPWFSETDLAKADSSESPTIVTGTQMKDKGIYSDDLGLQLLEAALAGQTKDVRQLLNNGANIEHKGSDERTPLLLAALGGHIETVDLLINRGANIKAEDVNRTSSLLLVAAVGHTEVATLLLDRGAEITGRDENGDTALLIAAHNGRTGMVVQMLGRGASIEERGSNYRTALLHAVLGGHTETVVILLNSGANTKAKGADQATPLVLAVQNGHTEIVELLFNYGATAAELENYGDEALLCLLYPGYTRSVLEQINSLPVISSHSNRTVALLTYTTSDTSSAFGGSDGRRNNLDGDRSDEAVFESTVVPLTDIYRGGSMDIPLEIFPQLTDWRAHLMKIRVAQFTGCSIEIAKAYVRNASRTNIQNFSDSLDPVDLLAASGLDRQGDFITGVSFRSASRTSGATLCVALPYLGLRVEGDQGSLSLAQYSRLQSGRSGRSNDSTGVMVHQVWFMVFDNTITVFRSSNDQASHRAALFPAQDRAGAFHALIQMIPNILVPSEPGAIRSLRSVVADQEFQIRNTINQDSWPNDELLSQFDQSLSNIHDIIRIVESQVQILQDLKEIYESLKKDPGRLQQNSSGVMIEINRRSQHEVQIALDTIMRVVEERRQLSTGLRSWLGGLRRSQILFSHGTQEAASTEAFNQAREMQATIGRMNNMSLFTLITVVFLPLGFFAQYFGIF